MVTRKKMGRPRVPLSQKVRRGTVEPSRERTRPKKRGKTHFLGKRVTKPRDFVAIADGYVADVLEGRITACRWTKLAVQRFQRMRAQAEIKVTEPVTLIWSPSHVEDVCAFIERLPHVEGRWRSATITLAPWQVFIFAACYGFRRPAVYDTNEDRPYTADGGRLVTTVFFQVGRKSAKSTLVAAAALYHLAIENEPGAQVVCGASTGNQARIVFSILQRMVRRSLWLRELGFVAYANAVTLGDAGGFAKPINAKSSTQDGLNPSFISLDESHAQTFELHDVLKSAQGARSDAALWAPTTAGYSLTSVGYALRATAQKILDGVLEADHVFCVLYELDDADDWKDESTWVKALPMIGITPSLDYVRRYCLDAQQTPGLQGEFETKCCNRWLHAASTWLSMPAWHRCADSALRLDDFEHEPCWIGVDLAERDDIAAVARCFRREDVVYVFVRGYLPALVVAERARAVPEYRQWLAAGELVATDGNLTDYPTIEADLRADCERFDVKDLCFERFGALNMAANLAASGLPARVESKNAKVFTPPAKDLEARIKAKQVRHTGASFLTWQVSNCCIDRRRDGSMLPVKDAPMSPNKIDAVDAILLALSGMLAAPTTQPYEPRMFFLEA